MLLTSRSPQPHYLPHSPAPYQNISAPDLEAGGFITTQEKRLITQLAILASQHHTSEYNRYKFGQNGSNAVYVPLSIQMPTLVKELQSRQAANVEKKAWWLSSLPLNTAGSDIIMSSEDSSPELPVSQLQNSPMPAAQLVQGPTLVTSPLTDLQQEISAAISSTISLPSIRQVKTSDSHPINISVIVPTPLMTIVSSHLNRASIPSPVIFDLHPSYFLDRLTFSNGFMSNTSDFDYNRVHLPMVVPSQAYNGEPLRTSFSTSHISEGMMQDECQGVVHQNYTNHRVQFLIPQKERNTTPHDDLDEADLPDRRLSHPPKRFLRVRSRVDRTQLAARSTPPPAHLPPSTPHPHNSERENVAPNSSLSVAAPPFNQPYPTRPFSSEQDLVSAPSTALPAIRDHFSKDPPHGSLRPRTFGIEQSPPFMAVTPNGKFGNLFLSSCPGKKVRLSGPVKGRGAICRDLRQDLIRIKELGVGCIVCCLDDDELDFLGVSWSRYSDIAGELGLDVLRLPTPEGLAPLTPASLDSHLTHLIESYTLRGIPILSHCRGGVGRAGLIACCWILKLGLCGWKQVEHCRPAMYDGEICPATIQLVERVISTIRRRRSLKAVETYEQVKFLVDYVEYLDSIGRPHAACQAHRT